MACDLSFRIPSSEDGGWRMEDIWHVSSIQVTLTLRPLSKMPSNPIAPSVQIESVLFGPELPFSNDEIEVCVKVLRLAAQTDCILLSQWMRPIRKALSPLVARLLAEARKDSKGVIKERAFAQEKDRIRQKFQRLDRESLARCELRAKRSQRLQALMTESSHEFALPLIPDGAASSSDCKASSTTEMPIERSQEESLIASVTAMPQLCIPTKCYVCERFYQQLHHFYHALCPACAEFNYVKRYQTANLEGKIALITGARVKIGYETTVKLLMSGATVIATTRFPRDAAERYTRHPQYHLFKDRLHLYGLDLRDLVHLHTFLDFIATTYPRLDMIIHNACQTIRRPPQFYRHLLIRGQTEPNQETAYLLQRDNDFRNTCSVKGVKSPGKWKSVSPSCESPESTNGSVTPSSQLTLQAWHALTPEMKSQVSFTVEDNNDNLEAFPDEAFDVNGQQVDLRRKNSWVLRLGEVETPELAEVFVINTMTPFVINNRLLVMLKPKPVTDSEKDGRKATAFIINVSAMEGKFYRNKVATHPHTNMAKAALNMMTRTCAADLSTHRVFMNSVDTGWINDEDPLHIARHTADSTGFQTPLDEVDAAARVLDPIFSAVNGGAAVYGRFLKDYHDSDW